MNVKSVEKKEKSIVDLAIELGAEEFDAEVESAYRRVKGSISIPGFRKGKVPRRMIENMYGRKYFYQDAVEACCPRLAQEAVEKEELKTVGEYSYSNFEFPEEGGFSFTVSVPVYPEVTLGEYKGLTAYKPPVKVEPEAIDREINSMRDRNSRQVTVDRAIEKGDIAVLDYEGFCDGVAFPGGKGENQSLTIGLGMFVPGFEEQLIGRRAGEEFTIDVRFPDEYNNSDLAGKDTKFNIKIHSVKEKQLPELDDEFAKDVSEYDTLAELRESIEKKLLETAENNSNREFRTALLKQAASAITADIPDAMVEYKLDQIVNRYASDMQQSGIAFEQFLQYMNVTAEEFRERFRSSALDQVKLDLMLEKVAEAESIEVTQEEIDEEYAGLAEIYGMTPEAVKARLPKETIIMDLRMEAAAKIIEESATATDVKPEEEYEYFDEHTHEHTHEHSHEHTHEEQHGEQDAADISGGSDASAE
ncbi:MAG: trigger factor [Clostridiales bacterium]|jgi:trigger factor|nr:trigger factor [Clostridiales bacterium]